MSSQIFQFNLVELIALFGLAQSIYILVYIAFRPAQLLRVGIPALFFLNLGAAFLLGLADSRWHGFLAYYKDVQWALWAFCAPLSTLLILQISRLNKLPAPYFFILPLVVPLAYGGALFMSHFYGDMTDWLHINATIVGAISLLVIWGNRSWLDNLKQHKQGKERFWLILCLIVMNVGLLLMQFILANEVLDVMDAEMIRFVIGISFIYIASTSLFRIYPQSDILLKRRHKSTQKLSPEEIRLALKIEGLLHLEKIYQEPAYGRSDMAKELSVTEAYLSKVVNLYFNKSVPQLLNEFRVEEAKDLLRQTDADITIIAQEAGFNSLATFNRAFKDAEGFSPSEYRKRKS